MRKRFDKNEEICNYGVQSGSRGAGDMLGAMSPVTVFFLMSVFSDLSPTRATNELGRCAELKEKWGINNTEKSQFMRFMSVLGDPYKIQLRGGGAARAAHELLHVLLRHLLRYTNSSIEHIKTEEGFNEVAKGQNNIATVSAALAWREQSAEVGQIDLPTHPLSLIGAGVAPVARRLFLHAAAKEPPHCRHPIDWTVITNPSCGYLSPPETQPLPSGWPNCTCSPPDLCVPVLVIRREGVNEAALVQLLVSLCSRVAAVPSRPTLQLVSSNQTLLRDKLIDKNSSFLYIDYYYDNLFGEQHAPSLPCIKSDCPATLENAVSFFVANRSLLYNFAPRVQSLLYKFKPSQILLQDISRNAISMKWEDAACKVATDNLNDIRPWLEPESEIDKVRITFYSCYKEASILKPLKYANTYWKTNKSIGNVSFSISCSKGTFNKTTLDSVANDIDSYSRLPASWRRLGGFVVLAEEGADKVSKQTQQLHVPLMLVQARGKVPAGVHAVMPDAAPLVGALCWLLPRCKWHRVAILREEGRNDFWELVSVENRTEPKKIHDQTFNAAHPDEALAKLEAKDARVIVVDAKAAATETVLRAALARNLTPVKGYAWIVLGSAGDDDWLPPKNFSYVTVSSWWRGGKAPEEMAGSKLLREQLDNNLNITFSPQTASFIDAFFLLMTGISKYLEAYPHYLYDLHAPDFARSMFALLENTSVDGLAQRYGRGSKQLVFVHRWTADGGRLVGMWPEHDPEDPKLCENVEDAPTCHTKPFGHDSFSPQCHDVAIAVVMCIMALTPPALCGAVAARRARLRRRDRALEERLLARSGHSAAATAALAAHAVPRSSLEILDELGFGHYGSVRLAILRAPGSAPLAVAAKSPREDAPAEAEEELLREAALLATLKHEHIVRFAGVCFEGAPLVLMENAFHGDLRRYLRAHRPLAERARVGLVEPEAERVGAPELTRLAREAAAALSYLKDCRLVHRDVRAANCLVDVRRTLKLADFGMARRLDEAGEQGAEYFSRRRGMFPVLWMAPESLTRGVFSAASDVWGLGVLLLELAMLGARPYGAWPAPRVLRHVLAGGTPPLPRDAAPSTRGLLAACWCRAPDERPSAASLVDYLARHPRVVQPALAHADNHDGPEGLEPTSPEAKLSFDDWN